MIALLFVNLAIFVSSVSSSHSIIIDSSCWANGMDKPAQIHKAKAIGFVFRNVVMITNPSCRRDHYALYLSDEKMQSIKDRFNNKETEKFTLEKVPLAFKAQVSGKIYWEKGKAILTGSINHVSSINYREGKYLYARSGGK